MRSNNELQEVSRGHSTEGKNSERAEQSLVLMNRKKEVPKPDGGIRKLGIPTVIDRIIQQAIQKVKRYAEQGYTSAVLVDLSKYFDTLNHELLMNLLRKNIRMCIIRLFTICF